MAGSWVSHPVLRAYAAVVAVSLLISVYLTWHLLGGIGQRMIAGNPDDVRLFEWYLVHGPWALLHGHDPLLFATMNAPAGVNGMWNTPLLVPALIMTPVTAAAGPLAAYNTLFVLGLAAGPVCAFALLRRFARSDWAAAVGGLVFGFSPAVLAAGLGHLDLVLIGLLPVILLLVHDLATGRRRALAGGLALGLAAAAQLFISEEILFQAGLVIVVCGALLLLTAPGTVSRAGLGRLARGGAVAAGVFLIICAGPLWLQLFGPLHQHGTPFTLSFFEADLRGFIVPAHRFWLSTPGSAAFAAHYGGGPAEYLAYLGVPLLLTALATGLLRIGDLPARLLLGTGLVFALFSLGSPLLVNGRLTAVRLPWGIAEHWPIFGSALPDRFAFVVALAAGGLLALGLDWLGAHWGLTGRGLAVALAVVCLAPLAARPYPVTPASTIPSFFNASTRWLPLAAPWSCCRTRRPHRPSRWPGRPPRTWRSRCRAATSSARLRAARRSWKAPGRPRRPARSSRPGRPRRRRRSPRRCAPSSGGTWRPGGPARSWPARAPARPWSGWSGSSPGGPRCGPAGCCSGGSLSRSGLARPGGLGRLRWLGRLGRPG